MSEFEKMIAGQLYNSSDPELVKIHRKGKGLVWKINQMGPDDTSARNKLVKELFGASGQQLHVELPFACDYGCNIFVGENFYANFGLVILDVAPVVIGKNCMIGPQVGIYTAGHPLDPYERNVLGVEFGKKITIGDDCWIGGHATINPGVSLGNNVIVASGAVVTKSFGDNVIIGGNPAKIIKENPPKEC